MPEQCNKHMRLAYATSNALSRCTYGRTYGLTKNYSPSSSFLAFVNARGGAQKMSSKWGGK